MRIVRFVDNEGEIHYGWVYEEAQVGLLLGSPFGAYQRKEPELPIEGLRLLAPVVPGKIVCVGRNYPQHAAEQGAEVPEYPLLFLKPPSAVIGPEESIVLPPQSARVDHEAELAVVIGKRGRWLNVEEAMSIVSGYTIANDVTARDLQEHDGQWTRAKGFDTFCPLGPWIETDLESHGSLIQCRVNGELRQFGTTADMVFPISQLLAFITSIMTLEPGDVVLTGTPAGVGPLQEGDSVEISIEGIGTLRNGVTAWKA